MDGLSIRTQVSRGPPCFFSTETCCHHPWPLDYEAHGGGGGGRSWPCSPSCPRVQHSAGTQRGTSACPCVPQTSGRSSSSLPPLSWSALGSGSAGPRASPLKPDRRAEHVQPFSQMNYNFPSFPLQNTLIKQTLLRQPIEIQKSILFLKNMSISLEAVVRIVETAHGCTHVHA